MVSLSACYSLVGLPTSSAFFSSPRSAKPDKEFCSFYSGHPGRPWWVQGRLESAILATLLVVGPATMHLLLRHRQTLTELVLDDLPLACLPFLLLRLQLARGSLWWTGTFSPPIHVPKDGKCLIPPLERYERRRFETGCGCDGAVRRFGAGGVGRAPRGARLVASGRHPCNRTPMGWSNRALLRPRLFHSAPLASCLGSVFFFQVHFRPLSPCVLAFCLSPDRFWPP